MIDRVGVVGIGMVGGAVARAFAEAGVSVCGYDRYLGVGAPEDLARCRVVFLCVPTPSLPDGGFDLDEVWSAAGEIEPTLPDGGIVAVKSTVPPGTIDRLAESFPRIRFAGVPEFLVATRPDETFTHTDRVVIGARSPEVASILVDLLGRVAPEAPPIVVHPVEAELAKLCSNALLAAKVAMANELADVCGLYGAAWPRVKAIVGLDRRIGPDHLSVTRERGFGGVCLPKDLDGLIAAAASAGSPAALLRAIAEFNRAVRSGAVPHAARASSNDSTNGAPFVPDRARGARG